MKKYENPMLQVVSINKNDVIVTSVTATLGGTQDNTSALGADHFRDFEEDYSY